MKQCKEYENLIPLYLSGDLNPAELIKTENHLRECAACRAYQASLSSIITTMKKERITVPESYGAELVVGLNRRLEQRRARQKRMLWAIPALTSAAAVILITMLGLLQPKSATNQWLAGLNQEHAYVNFCDVGYFGEILLDDEAETAEDAILSTDEIYENTVYEIIEEQQLPEVDRYLMATANLNDDEFQNIINQMKQAIL